MTTEQRELDRRCALLMGWAWVEELPPGKSHWRTSDGAIRHHWHPSTDIAHQLLDAAGWSWFVCVVAPDQGSLQFVRFENGRAS